MSAEGWAWLWLGGVYLVWSGIFVAVVIFALRTDTNVEVDDSDGRGSDRESDRRHPRPPRGRLPRSGSSAGRLRGAERLARDRRRRERAKARS